MINIFKRSKAKCAIFLLTATAVALPVLAQQQEFLYTAGSFEYAAAYSIDLATGAVSVLGNPFDFYGDAIAFSPNGSFGYISIDNYTTGGIAVAVINPNGALQVTSGFSSQFNTPFDGIAIEPGGHYAFAVSLSGAQPAIYPFTIDGPSGALTPAGPAVAASIETGMSMAVHPSRRYLFVASNGPSGLLEFRINPETGALTQINQTDLPCYTVAIGPGGVVYTNSGDGIAAYSVDLDTGALTAVPGSPFPVAGIVGFISIDSTGRFLYNSALVPPSTFELFGWLINPNTGALEQRVVGSPFETREHSVSALAVDNTNRFLYARDFVSASIYGYSIDESTGALKDLRDSPFRSGIDGNVLAIAPPLKPSTATLVSLAIEPSDARVNPEFGAVQQFMAVGKYSDGSDQYLTVSANWGSSDTNVATISNIPDSNGIADLLSSGSTTITAAFGGLSANTTLTVKPIHLMSITVTPTMPVTNRGKVIAFTATGTFNDGSAEDVTALAEWTTSDRAVASINARGEVYTKNAGTTVIAASSKFVTGSTTLTVNAK